MKRFSSSQSFLLFLSTVLLATPLAVAGPLEIHWIDVEGGAATLILTPAGESILIDTGLPQRYQVERIHDHLRDVAKLKHLDFLVVTHYDLDHHGGAAQLSTMIPIRTVYDNGRFEKMVNDPGEEYFSFAAGNRVVINPGDRIPLQGTAAAPAPVLRCVGTRQVFEQPPPGALRNTAICKTLRTKSPDTSENANSIVLLLEHGDFRFYDAADLTWNLESQLVCPVNLIGEVDVYQVTHHGLSSSNNAAVVQSLQPSVTVMNNGPTKGCHPETFATLKATRSIHANYQLHKNQRPDGNVNNTDDAYIANTEKDTSGNYIRLSVDPNGSTFTVHIPANGHSRTFRSKSGSR